MIYYEIYFEIYLGPEQWVPQWKKKDNAAFDFENTDVKLYLSDIHAILTQTTYKNNKLNIMKLSLILA